VQRKRSAEETKGCASALTIQRPFVPETLTAYHPFWPLLPRPMTASFLVATDTEHFGFGYQQSICCRAKSHLPMPAARIYRRDTFRDLQIQWQRGSRAVIGSSRLNMATRLRNMQSNKYRNSWHSDEGTVPSRHGEQNPKRARSGGKV
jgi:hypothetical protein